jgi:hypothetical protein
MNLRLHGQRAGDLHAAALAAGQRLAEAVAQVADVELLEQFVAALAALAARSGRAACLEDRQEVVADAHAPEDRRLLGQVADAAARPLVHGQAVMPRRRSRWSPASAATMPTIM